MSELKEEFEMDFVEYVVRAISDIYKNIKTLNKDIKTLTKKINILTKDQNILRDENKEIIRSLNQNKVYTAQVHGGTNQIENEVKQIKNKLDILERGLEKNGS